MHVLNSIRQMDILNIVAFQMLLYKHFEDSAAKKYAVAQLEPGIISAS